MIARIKKQIHVLSMIIAIAASTTLLAGIADSTDKTSTDPDCMSIE